VQFWEVRAPWTGDPDQVRRGVEALTGMELETHDRIRVLKPDAWLQRRRLDASTPAGSSGR
jgi:hypothetical protein